jgi:hypothetical protein
MTQRTTFEGTSTRLRLRLRPRPRPRLRLRPRLRPRPAPALVPLLARQSRMVPRSTNAWSVMTMNGRSSNFRAPRPSWSTISSLPMP